MVCQGGADVVDMVSDTPCNGAQIITVAYNGLIHDTATEEMNLDASELRNPPHEIYFFLIQCEMNENLFSPAFGYCQIRMEDARTFVILPP